jgi:hypothetical protein
MILFRNLLVVVQLHFLGRFEDVPGSYVSSSRVKGLGSTSLVSCHGRRNCIYNRACPPTILFPFLFSLHSYLLTYSSKYLQYPYPYLHPYPCPYLCLCPHSQLCPCPCPSLPMLLALSSSASVLWYIPLLLNIDPLQLLHDTA